MQMLMLAGLGNVGRGERDRERERERERELEGKRAEPTRRQELKSHWLGKRTLQGCLVSIVRIIML